MIDHEVYHAALEGRLQLNINIHSMEDGQTEASFTDYGMDVRVQDESQSFAFHECTRLVLEKMRESGAEVTFG